MSETTFCWDVHRQIQACMPTHRASLLLRRRCRMISLPPITALLLALSDRMYSQLGAALAVASLGQTSHHFRVAMQRVWPVRRGAGTAFNCCKMVSKKMMLNYVQLIAVGALGDVQREQHRSVQSIPTQGC